VAKSSSRQMQISHVCRDGSAAHVVTSALFSSLPERSHDTHHWSVALHIYHVTRLRMSVCPVS